jgi:hypothetical protein
VLAVPPPLVLPHPVRLAANNGDYDGDRHVAEEHQPLLIPRCACILFIEDPRHEHAAFQTWQGNEHPGQLIAAGRAACDNYGSPALAGQMTGQLDDFHADAGTARSLTRSASRLRLGRENSYHGGHLPVRADGRPSTILRSWLARLLDESVRDHNTRSALFGTARVCTSINLLISLAVRMPTT